MKLKDDRILDVMEVFAEDGRSEGFIAFLKQGYSWEGCSFIRASSIKNLKDCLPEIKDKKPI